MAHGAVASGLTRTQKAPQCVRLLWSDPIEIGTTSFFFFWSQAAISVGGTIENPVNRKRKAPNRCAPPSSLSLSLSLFLSLLALEIHPDHPRREKREVRRGREKRDERASERGPQTVEVGWVGAYRLVDLRNWWGPLGTLGRPPALAHTQETSGHVTQLLRARKSNLTGKQQEGSS
jgi:hypothetical protein